ncbi:MAG: hypothetical protein ABIP17_06625 [Ilumatobacteraceae bacterium]
MIDVLRHRRTALRRLIVVAVALSTTACGGGDSRPDASTWRPTWVERQALVPDAEAIIDGGEDLCGERLGTFRTEMPALRPTPTKSIDSSVDEWIALTETIVFECSDDPAVLGEQLDRFDALAAEVDAGLSAAVS